MNESINISEATIALIDSLKGTTNAFGLAGTGSEYRIVTEMFLYKFFNDKFGYEAKRDENMVNDCVMLRNGTKSTTSLPMRRWKTFSAICLLLCLRCD